MNVFIGKCTCSQVANGSLKGWKIYSITRKSTRRNKHFSKTMEQQRKHAAVIVGH